MIRPTRSFLLTLALLSGASVAHAQLPRVEGTLSRTQNGFTTKANISWEPPDHLRIELLDDKGAPTQIIIARDDSTLFWNPSTRRLQVLNANIARDWWRGSDLAAAGPANFTFTGGKSFQAAAGQGQYWQRGEVLFGGSGETAYYAAHKTLARRIPATVTVAPTSREEKDDAGTVLSTSKLVLDANGIPQSAQAMVAGVPITFAYALKPHVDAFADTTFALPAEAKDAIAEALNLDKPSSYAADGDANTRWNRGSALWQSAGDARGALASWGGAAKLQPNAVAPHAAIFDLAIALRDDRIAAQALDKLSNMGLSADELANRRVALLTMQHDFKAVMDLTKQEEEKNPTPTAQMALAALQKSAGQIDDARTLWKAVLASTDNNARSVQVLAAENLAQTALRSEFDALLASIPTTTDAQKLAHSLLELRAGKPATVQTFASDEMLQSLARGFERAGSDPEAKTAWETLEKRGSRAVAGQARLHQIALAALRGDATGALKLLATQNEAFPDRDSQLTAQSVLFDSFEKAFRMESLRTVLQNRGGATAASDSDLRLWQAWQAIYGDPKAADNIVDLGVTRFSKSAYWKSKKAESLVTAAGDTHGTPNGVVVRSQLYGQAIQTLDDAIALDPNERFYQAQQALIAIQRLTKAGAADANTSVRLRKAAEAALDDLEKVGDPDLNVTAALGHITVSPGTAPEAARFALSALDSPPGDGDRSTLVFAARQTAARSYSTPEEELAAGQQWLALLDVARSADDEAGVVYGALGFYEGRGDAHSMAALLVRLAGEKWDFEATRTLLSGAASRAAASPLVAKIAAELKNAALPAAGGDDANAAEPHADFTNPNTNAARLAWANLAVERMNRANAVVATPNAPPEADAEQERAKRDLALALAAVKPLAITSTPLFSAQAAVFLAQNGGLAPEQSAGLIDAASDLEPAAADVELARVSARTGDDAIKLRNEVAQRLDFSTEAWRVLATGAIGDKDRDDALFWSREAYNYAQHAPEIDANTFQRLAFARAKITFVAGDVPTGREIYTNLALPQWEDFNRIAALLSLRARYLEAGRQADANALATQIRGMEISTDDQQAALNFAIDADS